MKKKIIFLLSLYACSYATDPLKLIELSAQELEKIGNKMWYNECRKSVEKLAWWNKGEKFASMGIGHFIWYPKNNTKKYTETFPHLLKYIEKKGKKLPEWLSNDNACPWQNRTDFFNNANSKKIKELRKLLSTTVDIQTQFIIERASQALTSILSCKSCEEQEKIKKQFYRLAGTPAGLYALIDYINFKGEGLNPHEQYNGQGWGLRHVLLSMQDENGANALEEFAAAAKKILEVRIQNAPKENNEVRFLMGWKNRINTYTTYA
jgi:hypothetical protein